MKPENKDIVEKIVTLLHDFKEDQRFEILNDVKIALVAELQSRKNKLEAELEYIKGITQLK